ncbi:hypothetical protein [Undibacterium flavidum]|uniref:DUF1795 domain-containing protein n=1 Tax=Undibacterium flavidum TaxID=2762297 RepID=A0ABR6YAA9_9BURK|nr:hypothetical protein [Undibacterium flavidum]MBC3873518.1 hypothetical protein [Undibacterium flavidum]
MKKIFRFLLILITLLGINACTPKFDWREFRSQDAPISALFPGKPASHSREVDLDGIKVTLQMTATDVNQISFAIAYAKVDDKSVDQKILLAQQQRALNAMQAGMLKNIQAKLVEPSPTDAPKNTITALGKAQNGQSVKLVARFTQHGPWIIQAIMLGDEKAFTPEVMDMFFGSLKFN